MTHFACTDTVEFLSCSWMSNVQIFEFNETLKLLALVFLACVKRIMLRAGTTFYILLNILSYNNTVNNLQWLIISAFCSGCHQTMHHFELKEKPYKRLNTKWEVRWILINIAFQHRQLPKALHCLRYETRAKTDIEAKKYLPQKTSNVLTLAYHILQDVGYNDQFRNCNWSCSLQHIYIHTYVYVVC